MTSVMRYTKEVGGADTLYKVTSMPSVGFPIIRNGKWIKSFSKSPDYYSPTSYLIVRDLGGEAIVNSIDPLYITDVIVPALQGPGETWVDYQILIPGWSRRVQLIITPEIQNGSGGPYDDGNDITGVNLVGDSVILTDTLQTPVGPSPTFVGGRNFDIPNSIFPGYMSTKYWVFNVILRPLVIEYRVRDLHGNIQTRQHMFKNSMTSANAV